MATKDSELEKDMIASLAGLAVSEACGGPKKIASAASIDATNARRWARGERANPIYRTLALIDNAAEPWALVALMAAKAARSMLKAEGPIPEHRWRVLYAEACRAEQGPDGAEDQTTVALLTGCASVEDQFNADKKVLAATMRRLALGFYGITEGYCLTDKGH